MSGTGFHSIEHSVYNEWTRVSFIFHFGGAFALSSTMKHTGIVDIAIIGGGPAGMFAAFYAGMRQATCKIIESMPQLGGQLSALYPEKYIYDVAGFPKVRAQELVNNLLEQMKHFPIEACLDEKV